MAYYTLLGDHRSGNCYKVALAMKMTGTSYRWREIDVVGGATRSADFLAINPNGKVPLLQLPDGSWLAESNAMLIHLAEGTDLLPDKGGDRARVFQWLFFEQYSHEPYIAVARFMLRFGQGRDGGRERMEALWERGHQALWVMETTLARQPYMAGRRYSIADIALYAYTHVAGEGGFDLQPYPAVREWLCRVTERPDHFDLCDLAR